MSREEPTLTDISIDLLRAMGTEEMLNARRKCLTEQVRTVVEKNGFLLGGKLIVRVEFDPSEIK